MIELKIALMVMLIGLLLLTVYAEVCILEDAQVEHEIDHRFISLSFAQSTQSPDVYGAPTESDHGSHQRAQQHAQLCCTQEAVVSEGKHRDEDGHGEADTPPASR
jgi:hypothetical protein